MIRLSKVELLEYFELREDGQPRKLLLVAEPGTAIEYDEAAGLLWVRVEGRTDRFVPREHVKWAQVMPPSAESKVVAVAGKKR